MNIKKILMSLLSVIVRITILIIIILLIRRLCMAAYSYGYRIFSEEPVTEGNGTDVTVVIPMGSSSMDIGKILENNGPIRDCKLFYMQEKLSSYRGKLQPGTYTLNTSMTADEMMEVMAGEEESSTEAASEDYSSTVSQNTAGETENASEQ